MGYSGSRRQHNNVFWWVRTSCGMYRTESGEVVVAHGEDPLLALMGRGRSAKGFSATGPAYGMRFRAGTLVRVVETGRMAAAETSERSAKPTPIREKGV